MEMVQAKQLVFEYEKRDEDGNVIGSSRAIDQVDLDVKEGQFIAILGHNGSGKSTLAKHINAILLPTRGQVRVAGMDTREEDKLFDIREKAGMVFQNPDNQIVATVVEEDVAFAPENLGLPSQEIRRRVDEALKAVGMENFKRSAPHMLSGGQKQRVAIAGVLAMEPEVLVLDEPAAGLDPRGRDDIFRFITEYHEKHGTTVIFVTHSMEDAARLASRIVVMRDSHVFMDGPPPEIFSRAGELLEAGLDVPQITRVFLKLREMGAPVREGVYTVEQAAQEILRCKREGVSC